jgi:bifunctional non-homologous end joining protein LigD
MRAVSLLSDWADVYLVAKRAGSRAAGFVEPCIPTRVDKPPAGSEWVHEIKHDGYRLQVRRDGDRVRLFTRRGFDWTDRYPRIVEAATALRAKSFLIDGEVVVCGNDGVPSFKRLRAKRRSADAFMWAFDLIEHNGADLRSQPLERRKAALAKILAGPRDGISFNEHVGADGATVFAHACRMGLEGIVSKRLGAPYRSGGSTDWVKTKNLASPAARRLFEENW